LSKARSGAMAPGSGMQVAVVVGAMMEEGLGTGSRPHAQHVVSEGA
jgi:hypothetical protein